MRLAVIDIGTNSVLLIAAVITGKGTVRILRDESRIIRLGEDIYLNNKIGEPALRRTLDTLREYVKVCRDLHIEDIYMLGTEIFRCAENSSEIRDVISKQTGFPVEVLSGKEEALYTFRSALPEGVENNKEYIVIDIGGGSTEIIIGSPTGQHFTWSLPLGTVILTAGFLNNDPPELSELSKAQKYITERICRLPPIKQEKSAIGIGGTITTLAAVSLNINEFDAAKIEGKLLSKNSIKFILNRFLKLTAHERLSIPGIKKGREDIIIAGTAVLLEFLNYYMLDSIRVSTKGVRYGYLLSKAYQTG